MLEELEYQMEENEATQTEFSSKALSKVSRTLSRAVHAHEYLTREEELRLLKLAQENDDKKARERLILSHMRLANKYAGNTAHFNRSNNLVSHEDLLQEAVLGLDYAVTSFKPEMGTRFSTYATYWIRSFIQLYTHRNSFSVHVAGTSDVRLLVKRLRPIRDKLLKQNPNLQFNSQMLCQHISEETNITLELVTRVYQLINQNPLELNKRSPYFDDADGNELDLKDESDNFSSVDYGIDMERFRTIIQDFLKTLPERDKFIIEKRYFVEDNDEIWTLEMLAEKYNLSRERVRQIEFRVLKELRSLINGNVVRSRIKTNDKAAPKITKINKFQF